MIIIMILLTIMIILSLRASRRPGSRVHLSLLKGFQSSKFVSSGLVLVTVLVSVFVSVLVLVLVLLLLEDLRTTSQGYDQPGVPEGRRKKKEKKKKKQQKEKNKDKNNKKREE